MTRPSCESAETQLDINQFHLRMCAGAIAMNRLLRKASFFRIAAAAGGGAVLFYTNDDPISRPRISFSVPEQWRLSQYLISSISAERWQFGSLSFFSSRFNLVPDISNGRSSESVGDGHKASRGCLGRDTIANAAARVAPAVVNLSAPQGFYGFPGGKSIGSGTIIDANGTILTCAHVVVDYRGMQPMNPSSKRKIGVTLQDGRTFEGTVLNVDLHSDIAIVKINSKTPLPTAKLGSSSKIRPGEWVLAVGCPLSLQNTVTMGIISCVDRKSSDLGLGGVWREYLQTDCATNAGNSGGPLVNIDGEVVGVNIMKVLAADGLSFAVPIDSVAKIVEHFRKSGRVVRPWLGLRMIELNDMIIAQLKEGDPTFPDVHDGIFVPMVTPGSPADNAGFRPGDVLVQFDEKPVGSIKEVIDLMDDRVGVALKAVVKRPKGVTVTLTVIPEEGNADI